MDTQHQTDQIVRAIEALAEEVRQTKWLLAVIAAKDSDASTHELLADAKGDGE